MSGSGRGWSIKIGLVVPTGPAPKASSDSMGSVDEVEACVRRDYARLVRAVAVVTASTPAAEDAVQEAFARAWERASRGKEFSHLAGWVATVALNLARSGRRRLLVERRARRLTAPQREENNVAALVDLDRAVVTGPSARGRGLALSARS
jgi:DNA-directed RNA polymerase specialized sigma24 family protein